jgi:hypothetical protein
VEILEGKEKKKLLIKDDEFMQGGKEGWIYTRAIIKM